MIEQKSFCQKVKLFLDLFYPVMGGQLCQRESMLGGLAFTDKPGNR